MGVMLLKYMCLCFSKHTSSSRKQSPTVIEELCHQFSLADLRKSTNNFDESLIIGRGGFGDVYRGCLKLDGLTDHPVALKRMHRKSRQGINEFKNEAMLLCQLSHPNLVSFIAFYEDKKETIVLYEYMANGTLYDRLYCKDMEPLSWKKRLEICIGIAHGLHYLHTGAKRIIFHQNLSLHSILLDIKMVPKLTNFGLSLLGPRSVAGISSENAAINNKFSVEYDVYSFGVILLLVICTKDRKSIFDKINRLENQSKDSEKFIDVMPGNMDIYELVHRFPVEEIIDPILIGKIAPACWEVFIDIAEICLKQEPNERPTMGEVEIKLEYALKQQEEADARQISGDYILLSSTIFHNELYSRCASFS